ncbi:FAD/NAD(P)-binding domain-containing protein [Collybia nuda]|uniref:FAD/NAD(P)-binding domain-containing protein n=1 Tax=Collybia nuda TaxID=64659 RepID=A0A9P5YLA8_9AGAR|nr:FAD/NAD(P)-binding domain-containing protein [Collybia nuda]
MCGLLCAIGLKKAGIDVHIFEAAPKFDEIGAGVGLGPNALRALKELGVLDAVLLRADERVPTERSFTFVTGAGAHEHIYDYPTLPQDVGIGIYRPAFLEALLPLLDPLITHFNKRCTSISCSDQGTHALHFADGTAHETDLVVGADGIRSVVRNFVVKNEPDPLVFSNTVAYRALVSADVLESAGVKTNLRQRPVCFVGDDRHIITFPIQGKKMINIVAFSTNSRLLVGSVTIPLPWVESVSEKELLDEYAGWGNDARIILGHIQQPSKWYIHYLDPPLSSYIHQRIVLIGDAAHAMAPHLGSGVGQGFEDVFVLCALLGHPNTRKANLEAAIRTYDSIRRPRANMVLRQSSMAGEIYEAHGKDGETIQSLRHKLKGIWAPVWHHDLAADIVTVMDSLHARKARL